MGGAHQEGMRKWKIATSGIVIVVIGIIFLLSPAIAESSGCTLSTVTATVTQPNGVIITSEGLPTMCKIPYYFHFVQEFLGLPLILIGGLVAVIAIS